MFETEQYRQLLADYQAKLNDLHEADKRKCQNFINEVQSRVEYLEALRRKYYSLDTRFDVIACYRRNSTEADNILEEMDEIERDFEHSKQSLDELISKFSI